MSFSQKLLIAAAGLLFAIAGGSYWWRSRAHAAPSAPVRLAISSFENQSGDDSLDYLEPLFQHALIRQLEPIARGGLLASTNPHDATARGASRIAYGYLAKAQGKPVLQLSVEDATSHAQLLSTSIPLDPSAPLNAASAASTALARALYPGAHPAPLELHSPAAARRLSAALSASAPQDALTALSDSVQAEPSCGWCWLQLVEQTIATAGPQQALDRLSAASSLKTLSPLSSARLTVLQASLQPDLAKRRAALEQLAPLTPYDANLRAQLAEILVALRDYPKARAVLEQSLALDPSRAERFNSLAYACAYQGKFPEALAALDRYAASDNSANPDDSRGEILMIAGRFSDAAKSFAASYDKDKSFNAGVALEKAALSWYLDGDRKRAAETIERYLQDRAKTGDAWAEIHRARWEELFGDPQHARARLAAVAADANNPVASIASSLLALRLASSGESAQALQAAQRARASARNQAAVLFAAFAAVASDPSGSSIRISDAGLTAETQALAFTLRGDWKRAIPEWRKLIAQPRGGADAPFRELLAYCLVMDGQASPDQLKDATALLSNSFPLLTREQSLLYDFAVYPNLFYTRAGLAAAAKSSDAQRFFDLYLQYAGARPDRFGQQARARSAARL